MTSKTPAQIEALTVRAMVSVAAIIFLLISGLGGWHLWHKSNLASTHEHVKAKIERIDVLCAVEKKSGKSWRGQGIYACEEAKKLVDERNGALTPWRSSEGEYATLTYNASGIDQRKVLSKALLGERPGSVGAELDMYADRTDPQTIERPYDDTDKRSFWMAIGIGALVSVFVGALGWGIAVFNRRRQEEAIAGGGSVNSSGHIVYPANTSVGAHLHNVTPAWAKLVEYSGLAVLIIGLLLGGLAMAGASGDADAMRGGLVICVLSAGIWRICKYIAGLAKRSAATGQPVGQ